MTISSSIESRSPAETIARGVELAAALEAGSVLALSGELGAGKTCFVKGIAQGLGITEPITSPTFTLINEYRSGRLPLFHIDLYRLDSAAEAVAIGIEEYLNGNGVTVIEWAERIKDLLPERTRTIRLSVTGELTRRIEEP